MFYINVSIELRMVYELMNLMPCVEPTGIMHRMAAAGKRAVWKTKNALNEGG